jgi:XapX domain-containing protein
MDVKISILALVTGLVAGVVFTLLKLPLPAPPALPGILGIVGIYLGMKIVEWVRGYLS